MSRRVVGIDIGHYAVHAVAMQQVDRRWQLLGCESVLRRDENGADRPLSAILAELDGSLGIGKKALVYVSSSEIAALVKFNSTTPMPIERLRKLLRLELSQHADANGELAADSIVVPISGDEITHLCVLAQPNQVYPLVEDLGKASIKAEAINFGAAAMYNATLLSPLLGEDDLALHIDIGSATTQIALFGDKRLLACRQIAMGGVAFTEAIEKSLNVDTARAEQMKLHWAMAQPAHLGETDKIATERTANEDWLSEDGSSAAHNAVTEAHAKQEEDPNFGDDEDSDVVLIDDESPAPAKPAVSTSEPEAREAAMSRSTVTELYEAPEGEMDTPGAKTMSVANSTLGPTLSKVAEALYLQIASTQSWFKAQLKRENLTIKAVYLSGGGAGMVGLGTYFQRRFALPVRRLEPFAEIAGNHPEHAYEYAVALGLALSDLPGAAKVDLLPENLLRKKEMQRRLSWPYLAAALLFVSIFLTGWALIRQKNALEERRDAFAAYKAEYDRLKGEFDGLEKRKAELGEDLRAIASRIYSGRDLLYALRALKEKAADNRHTGLWVTVFRAGDLAYDDQIDNGPTVVQGGRNSRTQQVVRKDTSIQRGFVEITGRVRNVPGTEEEIKNYCLAYLDEVEVWKPEAWSQRLFASKSAVSLGFPLPDTKSQKQKKGPEDYKFVYKFYFQPTELSQVTDAQKVEGR